MSYLSPNIIGLVWALSEVCLAVFKRSRAGASSRDRHSLGLIWLVFAAATGAAVYLAYHPPAWNLFWGRPGRNAGALVFIGGLVLRWYAIFYLGRFFTVNVAIAADHRVIQTGPYSYIRHPSYTGGLLMIFGFGLCLGNLVSLAVVLVPCLGIMLWRMGIEEAVLLEALGGEYQSYMKRTRRLVPFLY